MIASRQCSRPVEDRCLQARPIRNQSPRSAHTTCRRKITSNASAGRGREYSAVYAVSRQPDGNQRQTADRVAITSWGNRA
jgi:hypothetical protein